MKLNRKKPGPTILDEYIIESNNKYYLLYGEKLNWFYEDNNLQLEKPIKHFPEATHEIALFPIDNVITNSQINIIGTVIACAQVVGTDSGINNLLSQLYGFKSIDLIIETINKLKNKNSYGKIK